MSFGAVLGKGVYIDRFGLVDGWCFVRTPENYKPVGKPLSFIVCNHGNGSIVDGSEAKLIGREGPGMVWILLKDCLGSRARCTTFTRIPQ